MSIFLPKFVQFQRGKMIAKGLVACWPGAEGAGSKVMDISGGEHHGTRNGTGTSIWTRATDQAAYAMDFNGTTDYIDFTPNDPNASHVNPNNLRMGTGDWSCSLWCYLRAANSWEAACLFDADGITLHGGKPGMLQDRDVVEGSTTVLTLNTWAHIAATRTGTTYNVYVNSELKNDGQTSPSWGFQNAWRMAEGWSANRPDCMLRDVRIYERVLTAKEVQLINQFLG